MLLLLGLEFKIKLDQPYGANLDGKITEKLENRNNVVMLEQSQTKTYLSYEKNKHNHIEKNIFSNRHSLKL